MKFVIDVECHGHWTTESLIFPQAIDGSKKPSLSGTAATDTAAIQQNNTAPSNNKHCLRMPWHNQSPSLHHIQQLFQSIHVPVFEKCNIPTVCVIVACSSSRSINDTIKIMRQCPTNNTETIPQQNHQP